MKNVLFLIHGVGRQPKDWSTEALGALDEAMKLYPACFPAGKKLRDLVDVVEIRYDDIFDDILDQWEQLASSLPSAGGFKWVDEIGKLLRKAGDDRNVFARYGGDVLLYCGFALVARTVRLRVNSIIATKIHRAVEDAGAGDPPKFGVLAHSLGTAIAQDALYQLATGNWLAERSAVKVALPDLAGEDAPDARFPAGLHALFLVADTSPLLHQAQALYSELRTAAGSYDCKSVCVISHDFDPICHVGGRFTGTPPAPRTSSATRIDVKHFHRETIHDLAHYLSHPGVHRPVFSALVPDFSLACANQARELAAKAEWQGLGGELKDRVEAQRRKLEQKLRAAVSDKKGIGALRETLERYARKLEGILP